MNSPELSLRRAGVSSRVEAIFEQTGGRTQISRKYSSYPLKIAKTFPFPHGQLGVYVMDASPGLMAGDAYSFDWELGPDSRVFLTNQSYTKVHPSRHADHAEPQPSVQRQHIRIGAGALLEYMPEPIMLYTDADYRNETGVHIEPGGMLIMSEVICPGRTHRGELFRYESYRSSIDVHYGGELVYCSRQKFEPQTAPPARLGAWDRFTHAGSLYACCEGVRQEHADRLREVVDRFVSGSAAGNDTDQQEDSWVPRETEASAHDVYAGVSLTYKHGLVLSVIGTKANRIEAVLHAAWAELRIMLVGLPPLDVPK